MTRCNGEPGRPGLHPQCDPNEIGPPRKRCHCGSAIPPLGRSCPVELFECDHRDDWPNDRSELWPGERRDEFGYPRCPGCSVCHRDCDVCHGTGLVYTFRPCPYRRKEDRNDAD